MGIANIHEAKSQLSKLIAQCHERRGGHHRQVRAADGPAGAYSS